MRKNAIIAVALLMQSTFIKAQIKHSPILQNEYKLICSGLYPESIDYDYNNNRFIIGSIYKSQVYTLTADGKLSTFITKSKIAALAGVYTDEVRNRLIVVGGDIGISEKSLSKGASAGIIAYVEIYNLKTGSLIKAIDLKFLTPNASAAPNDVIVDKIGNIYVTDSFAPVIYKIDGDLKATIFATSPAFMPKANAFGLNGIVFHPDGYLLAGKSDSNQLLKISIADPTIITEVEGIAIKSPDGLEFNKRDQLVMVSDGNVLTFASNDEWKTAKQVSKAIIGKEEFPTSVALAPNGKIYVILSKLNKLFAGDKTQSTFVLQEIK